LEPAVEPLGKSGGLAGAVTVTVALRVEPGTVAEMLALKETRR
jgi:hypothetical protein